MKTQFYKKCSFVLVVLFLWTTGIMAQIVPTITGPVDPNTLMPATLGNGITSGQVYITETGMNNYVWAVSSAGTITTPADPTVSNSITVIWTNPTGQQTVSVSYTDPAGLTLSATTVLIINYYPFPAAIDPASIPKFVDPLPHFAGGLRVDAKAGGNMTITAKPVTQVALSTGTTVSMGAAPDGTPLTGIIGTTAGAGVGNYAGYEISYNGNTYGAMWPARTIETLQGNPLRVKYENALNGARYSDFNILADQTLMMNGYTLTPNPLTDPYTGPIPMVVHLHGGEMPSGSDGGPNAWFMPTGTTGFNPFGPLYQTHQSGVSTYPNQQEATTLWYHPHDDGLTRINVYTGLAGYYFLRGTDEESAKLPGWSGDGLVQEVQAPGTSGTFNALPYLPEIEIAIQDRMFNAKGELYWPVAPTNPELHPFWTPEFVGDVMTVNGKTYPYLSVAPRKYRFRVLEGCNARFLNMWLVNAADGTPGPVINVIGGEGGLLANPVPVQTLLMAPGQRYDVVIDFTGFASGTTFTLMNDANAPYPGGDPVTPETSQIMQFVVNGVAVTADNSQLPANLRPVNPLVTLTDFNGNLKPGVTAVNKRQIVLNEVSAAGGPAAVLVNNSFFDAALALPGTPPLPNSNTNPPTLAGGPTELPVEGTTETFSIINISADAHPIHIHLLQWQLVSRQALDDVGYMTAYTGSFTGYNPADFPAGLGYPGGGGSPFPYNTLNADGAIGGNPAVSPFLLGAAIPANPEEMGWKDNVIVMPGEVTTFVVRVAPTDRSINATPSELIFPFDPSQGPGYVWHCHIVDHEDMSMMRPLEILPSFIRFPQITTQPTGVTACNGDVVTFTADGTSLDPTAIITYKWQVMVAGGTWVDLTDGGPYSGSINSTLSINTGVATGLSGNSYQCKLTNISGTTLSNPALLTINNCSVSGSLSYDNVAGPVAIAGATVTLGTNGPFAVTDATGAFTIAGVTSGIQNVTITHALLAGGINSTDAGGVNSWVTSPISIPNVAYLSGDVDKAALGLPDVDAIQQNFVAGTPPFTQAPWVYSMHWYDSAIPPALTVNVNGNSVTGFGILARSAGDFNGSFNPAVPGVSGLLFTPTGLAITVPAGTPFDLPLNAATAMQVGAVSLILNVPATMVTVNKVTVAGSTVAATWNFTGNVLKIGWNSCTPVNVIAGGSLVTINMTPTTAFTTTQQLRVTMAASYLNELADGFFAPVINAGLTVDNVKVTAKASTVATTITLAMVPNPALKGSPVRIDYAVPSAGAINLGIYDGKGVLVLPIPANTPSGSSISLGNLLKGNYYLRLTLIPDYRSSSNSCYQNNDKVGISFTNKKRLSRKGNLFFVSQRNPITPPFKEALIEKLRSRVKLCVNSLKSNNSSLLRRI